MPSFSVSLGRAGLSHFMLVRPHSMPTAPWDLKAAMARTTRGQPSENQVRTPAAALIIASSLATECAAADFNVFAGSAASSYNALLVNGLIVLSPVDQGAYGQNGFHDPVNDNYTAGICNSCVHGPELRNWFAFNISTLSWPVTSLTIALSTYLVVPDSVTYYMYDYGGSIPALMSGTGGTEAFADLGSGATLGQRLYHYNEDNTVRTINLNAAAVSSLNVALLAGQTQWAFGGATTTGNPLPIPEPSSQLMAAVGACVVGAAAWRKRSRRAYRPINFNSIDPLSAPPTAPHPPAPHPPHQYQPPTQSHVV